MTDDFKHDSCLEIGETLDYSLGVTILSVLFETRHDISRAAFICSCRFKTYAGSLEVFICISLVSSCTATTDTQYAQMPGDTTGRSKSRLLCWNPADSCLQQGFWPRYARASAELWHPTIIKSMNIIQQLEAASES
jgi:hypothetical protein